MKLQIIETPNGRFVFAGDVPCELALEYDDMRGVENAKRVGISIAANIAKKHGRRLNNRVFDSRKDAIAFALAKGYKIDA